MCKVNTFQKTKLNKYKGKLYIKFAYLSIVFVSCLLLIVSIILDFPIFIILILAILFIFFGFNLKNQKDISITNIVSCDCDADLWLYYLNTKKPSKTADHLIEYANALNLVGKLEEAKQLLSNIEVDQIKNKYNYIAYYVISLENAFYMNDIERVKENKKKIEKLSYPNPSVEEIIKRMQTIAEFYFKYMEEDYSYVDDLRLYIKQLPKKNRVKRVQASYLLYLTLLKKEDDSLAQIHLKNILTYGGTIFFVKELREDDEKIYHS